MLPRLLLHRSCRGGLISKDKLKERFKLFNAGRWFELLAASLKCDDEAAAASRPERSGAPSEPGHVQDPVGRIDSRKTGFGRRRSRTRNSRHSTAVACETSSAT